MQSHNIQNPWWAPRQTQTQRVLEFSNQRLHMVLVPRRALEGGRQSGKGWRYLRWAIRMRVFSTRKEECEGFHSSTHSLAHSPLHPFIPIHSFGHWLTQCFTCASTEPTEPEDGGVGGNQEEDSAVRTGCRCVHMTLRQPRTLQSNDFRISSPSWKLRIWIFRDFNT